VQRFDIIESIKAAQVKLASAENKFLYVTDNDVQVAIAEINAAKAQLNRLYEIAKEQNVKGEYQLYKSEALIRRI
jgi:multidrug efflux pump subunit AcrA (membrane-fusion protein)